MMRSTAEISVAVTECQPATEQELRYAITALNAMLYFTKSHLEKLAEAVIEKKSGFADYMAKDTSKFSERQFRSMRLPVDEYLGNRSIPGHPDQVASLQTSKAIFKKATGVDLDAKAE